LLCASAVVLVWHSLRFDFVTDDAYISFVYARNLAEHGELTFNLGERVEGYSNFSWTVLLAAGMALGVSPELSSRGLGTLCGVLVLLVVGRLTRRALGEPESPWAALPPALLALSSGFACWSSGGLETQLFTLLVVAAMDRFAAAGLARATGEFAAERRAFRQLGALLAVAAMTRPEGLLVAAVIGGSAAAANLVRARRTSRAAEPRSSLLAALVPPPQRATLGWFLALWTPWLLWRLWYYGWPFPNTYYVKAHGPWQPPELAAQMWRNGVYYLRFWLEQTGLLWLFPVALAGLFAAPLARVARRSSREGAAAPAERGGAHEAGDVARSLQATLGAFALAYLLYTVSVGGDFMGLHRFIMPVFAVAAIGLTLGLALLLPLAFDQLGSPSARRLASLLVALVLLIAFAAKQRALTVESVRWGRFDADRGIDPPAFLMVYTRDRAEIGKALRPCLRPDDFSVVGGAGAQPYFARMRAIDVFGLVSEDVAHRAPRIRARAGHTKFASDALLLERDPTFLFSCYALHPTAEPPPLGCAAPWLGRGYEQVTLHVPALRQLGTYYTFLAKRARAFQCPGRVR
jgi:arabinofuranosyltransferase